MTAACILAFARATYAGSTNRDIGWPLIAITLDAIGKHRRQGLFEFSQLIRGPGVVLLGGGAQPDFGSFHVPDSRCQEYFGRSPHRCHVSGISSLHIVLQGFEQPSRCRVVSMITP